MKSPGRQVYEASLRDRIDEFRRARRKVLGAFAKPHMTHWMHLLAAAYLRAEVVLEEALAAGPELESPPQRDQGGEGA